MSSGTVTVKTLVDELTEIFDDHDFALLPDGEAAYTRAILKRIITDEGTYSFRKASTGYYYYNPEIYLWDPTYTPTDDTSGTLHSLGSIEITSGTESADPIIVTGTPVDFPEVVVDICLYVATNRAQLASQIVFGTSMNVEDTQRKLVAMAAQWRGPFAL